MSIYSHTKRARASIIQRKARRKACCRIVPTAFLFLNLLLQQQQQYKEKGQFPLLQLVAAASSERLTSRHIHLDPYRYTQPAFFFKHNKSVSVPNLVSSRSSSSSSSSTSLPETSPHHNSNSALNMAHMDSPSAQRNKGPIWSVLQKQVPNLITTLSSDADEDKEELVTLQVLEVAAGVGVHTVHFASQMVAEFGKDIKLKWYPTDPDIMSRFALGAKVQEGEKSSSSDQSWKECIHLPALPLTLGKDGIAEEIQDSGIKYKSILQDGKIGLIICINMVHISQWEATIGLFQVASQKLMKNGILYLYGPYKENGSAVESNLNFDISLKARNADWGLRDLETVVTLAKENGFFLQEKIDMPANNLSLIFCKVG